MYTTTTYINNSKTKMKIVNLTQHTATAEQIAAGVVDLEGAEHVALVSLLTFNELPTNFEIRARARSIAQLATDVDAKAVMIGGAPWLMASLEYNLRVYEIDAYYSFSVRESAEEIQPDGSVKKVNVFRHKGFIG